MKIDGFEIVALAGILGFALFLITAAIGKTIVDVHKIEAQQKCVSYRQV